jgi:hypothetical protein
VVHAHAKLGKGQARAHINCEGRKNFPEKKNRLQNTLHYLLSGTLFSDNFALMALFYVESFAICTSIFYIADLQKEEVNGVSAPRTLRRQ